MSISTDMLDAFVKVATHLSVSAAAAELGVGKGVVSKRVAQLERSVKATLFSRSTRRVALTPAGEIYLDFARSALGAVRSADEQLLSLCSNLSGRIRLTAPVSWGQRVLAKSLPGFLATHPGIEIELLLEDRIMDLAYERVDIALRFTAAHAHDLVAIPVASIAWAVVAAPDYLAASGIPLDPSDLGARPCMCYWREMADEDWNFVRGERSATIRVRSRFRANNPEAVADAALSGLGIALLPKYVCEPELASGRLVSILSDWSPVTRFGNQITAVAAPDRMRFSRNQSLLTYLKQSLA
ncbi:MAG: LysR family transcriptional regulator [Betaproteobacteria bacterium]